MPRARRAHERRAAVAALTSAVRPSHPPLSQEHLQENALRVGKVLLSELDGLRRHSIVGDVRYVAASPACASHLTTAARQGGGAVCGGGDCEGQGHEGALG